MGSSGATIGSSARDWDTNARQALRLRRFRMAAGTSLMVIALLAVAYSFGGLERTGLVRGTALILFWIVLFYAVIRSGLNLRLRDPSFTMPQVASAIFSMAYIMYYADRGRGALVVVFLVAFLFGVFRLRTGQLLRLALAAILAYALMVVCLFQFKPQTVELVDEILVLIVLGVTLPWFAVMGGYVSKLRDDMRTANRELESARIVAEAGAQAKTTFLASMSHEIRTPMNGVLGMTSLLLETPLTSEQRDYVETIRASGDGLLAIINEILDFSKIDAGKLDLDLQPFDLQDCIEDAIDLVAPQAQVKGLHLSYQIATDVPRTLVSDATRVRQILVNLLGNAVKFTDAGEVAVSVSATQPEAAAPFEVQFAVRDTGIGIPEDQIERLFESFSQVDASTTRKYGGTGLGLAISRRLTELLGGRIWVESTPGQGTTFFFVIPARAGAALRPESDPGPQPDRREPRLAGRRVLIVEDHDATRQSLQRQTEAWGFAAVGAASGAEALALLDRGDRFDLMIVDRQMPGMDGLALAAEIRRRLAPAPPLILLSPLGRREPAISGIFAASLTKPVRSSRLYDAVAEVLSVGPAPPVPIESATEVRLADRHPLRILMAEDNLVNQKVAASMLARFGYAADVVANGVEAVEAVRRVPYDIVLMDLQMPELDGLGAARQIIAEHAPPHRPRIVALTANAFEEDRQACLVAGMDDYLSKPLKKEALEAALGRTSRRPVPPAA